MSCYSDTTSACLCDRIDIAKQLSEAGKTYEEIAIDKKLKKDTMGNYFSDELLIKQNEKLGAMYKRDEGQIEIMYLWYKYFSDESFETISPVQIIQSIRSGIK